MMRYDMFLFLQFDWFSAFVALTLFLKKYFYSNHILRISINK